jgi:signal transduction histidine kinase
MGWVLGGAVVLSKGVRSIGVFGGSVSAVRQFGLRSSRPGGVSSWALAALVGVGIVATAWTAWFVPRSPVLLHPTGDAAIGAAYIASLVVVGTYTWYRRPRSPLGLIIAADGLAWALTTPTASGDALAHTIGETIWAAWIVFTTFMYLSFPSGGLGSRMERGVILAYTSSAVAIWGLILIFAPKLPPGGDFINCGDRCPRNGLEVVATSADFGDSLTVAYASATALATLAVAMLIFAKTRSLSALGRRAAEPLSYVLILNIVLLVLLLLVRPSYPGTTDAFRIVNAALSIAIPIAILAGQLRGHLFAEASARRLAISAPDRRVTPERVQEMLRATLGDDGLVLAIALDGGQFVDVAAQPITLPAIAAGREVTHVVSEGRPVAALIHVPQPDLDPVTVEGVAASALLLLENARLVEELRLSRQRIVVAADEERRRLERDLHDGAQQRLLLIQAKLHRLRRSVDGAGLAHAVDDIAQQANAAIGDLRAIAHGVYPAALSSLGVTAALLEAEAIRDSPTNIEIVDNGFGRHDAATETAIFYCALEAVQNATKHAGANAHVGITLERSEDSVRLRVTDDGQGFDSAGAGRSGQGLQNMRERIEAVGGECDIWSEPGYGTTIEATVRVTTAPPG